MGFYTFYSAKMKYSANSIGSPGVKLLLPITSLLPTTWIFFYNGPSHLGWSYKRAPTHLVEAKDYLLPVLSL